MVKQITAAIGALLTLLGLGAYVTAPEKHVTALLPSFLGLPLLVLSILARNQKAVANAMHAAAGVSALGLMVSLQGLLFPQLFQSTADTRSEHPQRTMVQGATAVLCGTHQAVAFKSFLDARRSGDQDVA